MPFFREQKPSDSVNDTIFEKKEELLAENGQVLLLVDHIMNSKYRQREGSESTIWRAYYIVVQCKNAHHTSSMSLQQWYRTTQDAKSCFWNAMSKGAVAERKIKDFALWVWHSKLAQSRQREMRGIPEQSWDYTPASNYVLQMQRLEPGENSLVLEAYDYAREYQEKLLHENKGGYLSNIPEDIEYARKRRERAMQRHNVEQTETLSEADETLPRLDVPWTPEAVENFRRQMDIDEQEPPPTRTVTEGPPP